MPGSLVARGHHIERQFLTRFYAKAKEVRVSETCHPALHNGRHRKFLSFFHSVVGFLFDLTGPTGHSKQKWIGSSPACLQVKDPGARAGRGSKLHVCAKRQNISRMNRSRHVVAFTAQPALGIEEITRQFQRHRMPSLAPKREHSSDSGLAYRYRRGTALTRKSGNDLE